MGTNLITLFSNAKIKISYYKWYSTLFYNHNLMRLDSKNNPKNGFAIDNRLLLLKPLIKEKITNVKPKLYLSISEKKEAKEILEKSGIDLKNKALIMMNILGSEAHKTLPFHKMAKIIDFIVEKTNANILFNYIPNQKKQALEIYNSCEEKTKQNIHFNLYGSNLRQFMGLLSYCDTLIGNEGGAINMAKALEIPTFSIFSPSIDKNTWQVFEDNIKNVSIHLIDIKPEIFEFKSTRFIRKNSSEFYNEFPEDIIIQKIDTYLDNYKN
nr:glycosyltransferase family 9 protein [Flavobacterium cellulosilyticum]